MNDIRLKTYDELIFEITKLNTDKFLLQKENQELKKQQKEFIEHLERKIKECDSYFKYIEKMAKELKARSSGKTYLASEIMKNEVAKKVYQEILALYKGGGNNANKNI